MSYYRGTNIESWLGRRTVSGRPWVWDTYICMLGVARIIFSCEDAFSQVAKPCEILTNSARITLKHRRHWQIFQRTGHQTILTKVICWPDSIVSLARYTSQFKYRIWYRVDLQIKLTYLMHHVFVDVQCAEALHNMSCKPSSLYVATICWVSIEPWVRLTISSCSWSIHFVRNVSSVLLLFVQVYWWNWFQLAPVLTMSCWRAHPT